MRRAFSTFSLPQPAVVAAQAQPDPEFTSLGPNPPNPEEGKGVWSLAYETGGRAPRLLACWMGVESLRSRPLIAAADLFWGGVGPQTRRSTRPLWAIDDQPTPFWKDTRAD